LRKKKGRKPMTCLGIKPARKAHGGYRQQLEAKLQAPYTPYITKQSR